MVVENLVGSSSYPKKIRCLDENSFVGGTVSAIGTNVTSLYRIGAGKMSGTSMATPQVAGLAAYLLAIDSSLSPQRIKTILLATKQDVPNALGCSDATAAPAIDAYAAVLALDKTSDTPVRDAILDIAGGSPDLGQNGQFDENDLTYYTEQINTGSQEIRDGLDKVKYSRADLNGDGYDGGRGGYTKKFNLDMDFPPTYTTLTKTIEDQEVEFDENELTDNDILCYYAYSDLYNGDTDERKRLMASRCKPSIVAVYYDHSTGISFPGSDSACSNTDERISEERETASLRPLIETQRPKSHYWSSTDGDIEKANYSAAPIREWRDSNGDCTISQQYSASADINSYISIGDGNRVEIDITATAQSECYNPITETAGWECSEALANTTWVAEFDFKVKIASRLKAVVNFTCTGPNMSGPGYPDTNLMPPIDLIAVAVVRVDSTGNVIMTHSDPTKLVMPQTYYCNDDNPTVLIEQIMEFDAPATEGTTDRVTVLVRGMGGAWGNLGNPPAMLGIPLLLPNELNVFGSQTNTTTMSGYVQVVPAN